MNPADHILDSPGRWPRTWSQPSRSCSCKTFPRREDALEAVEAEEPLTPASDPTE